jgi:hypothetical protein
LRIRENNCVSAKVGTQYSLGVFSCLDVANRERYL